MQDQVLLYIVNSKACKGGMGGEEVGGESGGGGGGVSVSQGAK